MQRMINQHQSSPKDAHLPYSPSPLQICNLFTTKNANASCRLADIKGTAIHFVVAWETPFAWSRRFKLPLSVLLTKEDGRVPKNYNCERRKKLLCLIQLHTFEMMKTSLRHAESLCGQTAVFSRASQLWLVLEFAKVMRKRGCSFT